MNTEQTERNPPAILVLTQVIREYRAVNDPEGLGRLLFPLEQCLSGEEYEPPKTAAERFAFNRLLVAAERGRESYEKMARRGRAGAAASNAARRDKVANPSPSEPVATVAAPVSVKPPAPVASVPSEPQTQRRYITAPVARPNPSAAQERRGGSKSFADCVGDLSGMFGGAGLSIADRIGEDPVGAGLEIIGETESEKARNTLKKLVREKGAAAVSEILFAFNSEINNGEEPKNRGAALFARLKELPNISAGR